MASEIVKMVAKKANLSEPVAQIAVNTVLSFVKTKLPANVGGILDSLVGTSSSSKPATKSANTTSKTAQKNDNPLGDLGNIVGSIGGLFGKK